MLPKFKLEYGVDLIPPLQAMGMKTVFGDLGDFSGIGSVGIYRVRQKTFIEVKEEGTEAAAVTSVGMAPSGTLLPPSNPFQMIVDRPFLFLIEDQQTGMILFTGVDLIRLRIDRRTPGLARQSRNQFSSRDEYVNLWRL